MAVPTSNQQLFFSSLYRAAIVRPSTCKASASASSVVVMSSPTNSSRKAEGPPWLVDERRCSSQKLQLAKAQENRGQSLKASRDVTGRSMTSVACEVVHKARTARKKANLKATYPLSTASARIAALLPCPSSRPVTLAVRFVSWTDCLCSKYWPNPGIQRHSAGR